MVAILDSSGNSVVGYAYDAWGNILSITGSMASTLGRLNPLTYRGYVYDWETGLYYLQSRYYNPQWCRFLNADSFVSTGQGIVGNNMFAYCNNNPVIYADYSGEFLIEITVSTAGLIVGVTICGIALAHYAAMAITTFIDWLASQWYYTFAKLSYVTETANEAQVTTYSEHTKNQSEKNRNKHENANARRKRDQGGEKKKQKKKWQSRNKGRVRDIDGTY